MSTTSHLADTSKLISDIFSNDNSIQSVPIASMKFPSDLWRENSFQNSTSDSHICWPPVVAVKSDPDLLQIIDGCKRVTRYTLEGRSECPTVVLENGKGIDPGLMRIVLNSSRILSSIEKLLFLKWLSVNLNKHDYLLWAKKLNVSDRERFELEKLFTADDSIITAVERGILDTGSAGDLVMLPEDDRSAILELFSELDFSRQMQRELAEWIPEIAFRNGINVKSVLEDEKLTSTLQNTNLNTPQKMQRIRNEIYSQRFPFYSGMQSEWKRKAASANPHPSQVHFIPSPGFEKRKLEMKITVKSAAEAKAILDNLASLPSDTWEELIFPHN